MSTQDRVEQIRRAHSAAKPTATNPAWLNSHNDCRFLLEEIDRLRQQAVPRWVGLRDEEKAELVSEICQYGTDFVSPLFSVIDRAERTLRELNATEQQ